MAWVILLLVLLAAAFGVLGAVLKLTAILVLTALLTVAALVALVSYSVKSQIRRWEQGDVDDRSQVRMWPWGYQPQPPRDLPSHDDRY